MKYLLFLTLLTSSLSAFSIGRDGAAFEREEISWQPVKLVDSNAGFTATLPGEPRSGLSNGFVYSASKHNDVWYEVHTTLAGNYKCPNSEKAFIDEISTAYKNAKVSLLKSQKPVQYTAELNYIHGGKALRLYATKSKLYTAIVEGDDLSLAPYFFSQVKITQ